MKPVTLTIDGRSMSVDPTLSILEAARQNGIDIPTLCFNKELEDRGSCWLCIVELKGRNRFIPACNTRVSEGLEVETDNAILRQMRRQNLERIIARHCGDCFSPCERSCPAGCNIAGFTGAIAAGQEQEALRIIMETIPLPGILGRVCPAPCQDACRRHGVDEPVAICALKRYAADANEGEPPVPERRQASGKRVAIVGAGPAGLTAAYFLLSGGHEVTIIDDHEQPGGMMRYGIPRFRLPEQVIENDIRPIRAMGASFRMSTRFGTDSSWSELSQDHDALLLAVGASAPARLNIPGEACPGVVSGIDFLAEVASGKTRQAGMRVIVIGGGNTAIDAARTALRLGAEQVRIMYRRGAQEMPANRDEIREAVDEGVSIEFLTAPTAIEQAGPCLMVHAVRMALGEPGADGRRRPMPVEGSAFTIDADMVITATGQTVVLPEGALPLPAPVSGNAISVDDTTFETGLPGIFACGDCATGPELAVNAVAQGRHAAMALDRHLSGKPPAPATNGFNSTYGARDRAPEGFYNRAVPAGRVPVPELAPAARTGGFDEVIAGYGAQAARQEAQRCLQCRCNAVDSCRLRELAGTFGITEMEQSPIAEEFAIDGSGQVRFEREKCVDCGICVRTLEQAGPREGHFRLLIDACPTGAITG